MKSSARHTASSAAGKPGLHPRNPHHGRYDFAKLTQCLPELAPFVVRTPYGDESIDFSDSESVRLLNQAILGCFYNIKSWNIPDGYLCPPVPGRADYIHHIADLLAHSNQGEVPRGPQTRVLDIGVGANCIYPIIGQHEYGWSFIGSDVDPLAIQSARKIAESNPALGRSLELRLQTSPKRIFEGVLKRGEKIHLSVCNPPFHSSAEEARDSARQKWKKLGKDPASARNFGGQGAELWYPGGESEFIRKMIIESRSFSEECRWFSTLVSKVENLHGIYRDLKEAGVADFLEKRMSQGQKTSRIVAWTYLK